MPISPSGFRDPGRANPVRAIEEAKRLVVEQLGSLPGTVYAAVEQGLRLSVALAPIDSSHNPYQDQAALWVLRQHHATHVMAYRQQLAESLDNARIPGRAGATGTPLELLGEAELEGRLDAQRAAEPLENTNKIALEALDGRFAALARCVGRSEHGSNPIAPLALMQAFMAIFAEEQVPATLRAQLLKQYEVALVPLLPELYARVHALLAEYGFGDGQARAAQATPAKVVELPPTPARFDADFEQVPIRAFRPDASAPRPSTAAPPWNHVPGQAPAPQNPYGSTPSGPGPSRSAGGSSTAGVSAGFNPNIDPVTAQEIGELRSLLHVWRQSAVNAPAAGASAGEGTGAHGPVPPTASGRSQAASAKAPRDLSVHELMGVASLLQREQADALARALVGGGRLAPTIRNELRDGSRRLGLNPDQVRFTPDEDDSIDLVAMLFEAIFASHTMADRARRVYGRLVLPMVKVALQDPSLFVRDVHPARRLLEAVTEACAGNEGETTQERELLDRAAAAVQRVAADFNEDTAVFELARTELDGLLAQQRRRIEIQEERAAQAALGRERLQRAREEADAIVTRRLAGPPVSRDVGEFLATTWRHHLVQAFLRDSTAPADAAGLGDALVAADRAAAAGEGRELADRLIELEPALLSCLASSGHDDSAARHCVATLVRALVYPDAPRDLQPVPVEDNAEDLAEARLWLANDAAPAPGVLAERMAELAVGDWVQLTNRVGDIMVAKVAWISPLTERRLLVNRRGVRVFAASIAQLAQLAHETRVVRINDHAAVDDAMRLVRQRLHEGASLH